MNALLLIAALTAPAADTPGVTVDAAKKAVTIDAKVAPRKLPHLDQVYPIEVVACSPHPKGKKAHETVLTIEARPSDVHKALEAVGLKPGKPVVGGEDQAAGPDVVVSVEVPSPAGPKKVPVHRLLVDRKTQKPLPKDVKFRFTGSVETQPNPDKPEKVYGADVTGTLIAVYPVTAETVMQTSLTMKEEKYLKLEVNKQLLPAEGEPVKLVLEAANP